MCLWKVTVFSLSTAQLGAQTSSVGFIISKIPRSIYPIGCLASRSHAMPLRIYIKGRSLGQTLYRRTETSRSRQCHRPFVIACFCNFVASCSFPLCVTAKVRRENGTVRHVVELSFERLLKHILRTYVGQHIRRSERWTS